MTFQLSRSRENCRTVRAGWRMNSGNMKLKIDITCKVGFALFVFEVVKYFISWVSLIVVFKAFGTGKARLIMLCSLMGPQLFCRLKCTAAWLARPHVNIWTWKRPPVFMHNHDVSLQGVVLAKCFVTPFVTSTFPFFFLLVCSFMSS